MKIRNKYLHNRSKNFTSLILGIIFVMFLTSCKGKEIPSEATTLGNSSQISLHQNNRVISFNIGDDYAEFIKTSNSRSLVKPLYKELNDDFDFITFILNENEKPESQRAFGYYSNIKNHVQYIGINIFDNSATLGSKKLQGVLTLTALPYLKNGPSLHEIAHKWGNYLITEAEHPQLLNGNGGHWGTTGGNTRGQLGGFVQSSLCARGVECKGVTQKSHDWLVDGFVPNALGGNSGPYNQLELYLMGLISAKEVEPFDVFTDVSNIAVDLQRDKVAFDATKNSYTPADFIKKGGGRRFPLPADEQKDYKMLIVVITGRPLTTQEWKSIDADAEWFGKPEDDGDPGIYNFWEATGGRATMETGNLEKSLIN